MQLKCTGCGGKGFTLKSKSDVFLGDNVPCLYCGRNAYLPASLLLLLKIIYSTISSFVFLGFFYLVGIFLFLPLSIAFMYGLFKVFVMIFPVVFRDE